MTAPRDDPNYWFTRRAEVLPCPECGAPADDVDSKKCEPHCGAQDPHLHFRCTRCPLIGVIVLFKGHGMMMAADEERIREIERKRHWN